jgi:TonB-dependent receptor
MPNVRRFAVALLLAAVPAARAVAQGSIVGTVVADQSNLALPGASIQLTPSNRGAFADQTGRFTLSGVAAGQYTVTVRYIGYAATTATVTVADGRAQELTVRLKGAESQLLGTVLVTGQRTGQAAALAQQQANVNVSNVVASDQIGRFPDQNIGDALKRVPGITIQLDQGEARFGQIRGTDPRFATVMVNGERVPSAEGDSRVVQLDLIPADMVQLVEVNKTVTADMDGDAIGGAVNIQTRQAPTGGRVSYTLGSGYNFLADRPMLQAGAVLGNRFLDDKLGVIVAGSYFDHRLGSDNIEGVWDLDDNGNRYLNEFQIREYVVDRTRRSLSGAFDYRFAPGQSITYRTMYNHRDDWENRFRVSYTGLGPAASGGTTTSPEIRRQTKGGGPAPENRNARLEDQRTIMHSLAGDHLVAGSRFQLTWSLQFARASERRPDERYIDWRARNVPVRVDFADPERPFVSAVSDATVTPASFTFRRIELLNEYTDDEDLNGRVDLTMPLRDGRSILRFGGRYRGKEKVRDNAFSRGIPASGFLANMSQTEFRDLSEDDYAAGSRYRVGNFTTPRFVAGLPISDPGRIRLEDRPDEYGPANFDATEAITAGYVRLDQRLGAKATLIAGLRVEATAIDYNANEYDVDENEVRPTSGSDDYVSVLPSIMLKYDWSPSTVVRAAVGRTLARPDYFALAPYRIVALDDNELELGNPNLKPTLSTNLDLSIEKYYGNVGLLSAGVFFKDIQDFIFQRVQQNTRDPVTGNVFDVITQPFNGQSATVVGFETAVQRQLDFLPGLARWFGVYANYTYSGSSVEGITGRTDDLPLPGNSKHSGNISLSWDHPRFTLRGSVQYQSAFIDPSEGGYGDEPFFDRYIQDQTDVDVNGTWTLTPRLRWYFEANNLANRPIRATYGDTRFISQLEYYRARVTTGFKVDW